MGIAFRMFFVNKFTVNKDTYIYYLLGDSFFWVFSCWAFLKGEVSRRLSHHYAGSKIYMISANTVYDRGSVLYYTFT